jgi:hypothetical protein
MITYDPGYWGTACIFQRHGSVFPKAMMWSVPCTLVAGLLHYGFAEDARVKEHLGIGGTAATVFGGFNFILGFLVVFDRNRLFRGGGKAAPCYNSFVVSGSTHTVV